MGVSIAISIFAVPVSASCSSWIHIIQVHHIVIVLMDVDFMVKRYKKHRAYQERYCAERW